MKKMLDCKDKFSKLEPVKKGREGDNNARTEEII